MKDTLDIVFCGLACFDPLTMNRYHVLLPDGRNQALNPFNIEPHHAWIGVRPRKPAAEACGFPQHQKNDFLIHEPRWLRIEGLEHTEPNDDALVDRLPNLRSIDNFYVLHPHPQAILGMVIDRGTLSAHQKQDRMILVRWRVKRKCGEKVRFVLGHSWIEIGDGVEQVIIANISTMKADEKQADQKQESASDFNLYRKLSTNKTAPLVFKPPSKPPLDGFDIEHPGESVLCCPLVDCSPAFSR